MSGETIYVRVPKDLKVRVEAYAASTAQTQARAVAELIEAGLDAIGSARPLTTAQSVQVLLALMVDPRTVADAARELLDQAMGEPS